MGIPLIGNDFISPPPPPSAVSNTTAQLMAQAGAMQADRIEKSTQALQAAILSPMVASTYATGYKKLATGDMSGFDDLVHGQMASLNNPLLAQSAHEAMQVGTTVAHNYITEQARNDLRDYKDRVLVETNRHNTINEGIAKDKVDAAGNPVGKGTNSVAQQRLDFNKQQASAKLKILLANKQAANDALPEGEQKDESPVSFGGFQVPFDTDPKNVDQILQLDQATTGGLDESEPSGTAGEQQDDGANDIPLPVKDEAALPSQNLPKQLHTEPGGVGTPSAAQVPLDGSGPTLVNEKPPVAPKAQLQVVKNSQGRYIVSEITRNANTGLTVKQELSPDVKKYMESHALDEDKYNDAATDLGGNLGLHRFMLQQLKAGKPVTRYETQPITRGGNKEDQKVVFGYEDTPDKDHPDGFFQQTGFDGKVVEQDKKYGIAFDTVKRFATTMKEGGIQISSPEVEEAMKPAASVPAKISDSDQKYINDKIGYDEHKRILEQTKDPKERSVLLQSAYERVQRQAKLLGPDIKPIAIDEASKKAQSPKLPDKKADLSKELVDAKDSLSHYVFKFKSKGDQSAYKRAQEIAQYVTELEDKIKSLN